MRPDREQEQHAAPAAAADSAAKATTTADAATSLIDQIDFERLPRHIAIIMDGNGRWARQRHLPRIAGHRAGIAAVREVLETSARLGIEVLTLYAFSRENWSRPASEVNALMRLLREYVDGELTTLCEKNIRFRTIGRISDLPAPVVEGLARAERATAGNTGMTFLIALSYSGRSEIVDAAVEIAQRVRRGQLDPEAIDEDLVSSTLNTAGLPDPDLLIRSSGERRISNFLLWQIAYAELFITPVLWPDFRRQHLLEAIVDFQARERRFGGVRNADRRSRGAAKRHLLSS
ncbi:MAG: isoprenyl transferase [Acidobacteriota bacterium]|nr:MAG: isoprenyl transferase [Acidobacteriota bacterium]